jgi:hypothetical protein
MIVESHSFKDSFVKGDAAGFVVCDESPPILTRPIHPAFAEIYGTANCYHIFEDRAAAERHLALATAVEPPRTSLLVREVRVEHIRDYQSLAGRKSVYLVNRAGDAAQSLRVGDMPLAARTNTPFPGPLPASVRIIRPEPPPKLLPSTPPDNAAEAVPSLPAPPRIRRPMRLVIDPSPSPSATRTEVEESSTPSAPKHGVFRRLLRILFS